MLDFVLLKCGTKISCFGTPGSSDCTMTRELPTFTMTGCVWPKGSN